MMNEKILRLVPRHLLYKGGSAAKWHRTGREQTHLFKSPDFFGTGNFSDEAQDPMNNNTVKK